ncbi:importin subunit alpha-8 [Pelomyxa schiedti]|nr:importin subunit alpha-8 [Pelomyxa schiedti]
MSDYPKLQYEAAWAITNVSSGTTAETEEVIKNGGVSALLSLLASHDLELCEQAIWGLGNIAGDSTANRDLILSLHAIPLILALISRTMPSEVHYSETLWFDKYFFYHESDADVCSGLSYITDTTPTLNKYIFDAKIVQQHAKLLRLVTAIFKVIPTQHALSPYKHTTGTGLHPDQQTPNKYKPLFTNSLVQKLQQLATTPDQILFVRNRFGQSQPPDEMGE